MGICCITQGTQTGPLWQLEGWDVVGAESKVQGRVDICIPTADSWWCMAETNTTL